MSDGVGMSLYGIGSIYKRYASVPDEKPVLASTIHAWVTLGTPWETTNNPPEIWVWNESQRELYSKFYPINKIRAVGSAFCYLKRLLKVSNSSFFEQKSGSVFFTPHSIPNLSVIIEHNKIIDWILKLSHKYYPVSVFLYHIDAIPETVKLYEESGIQVLINGHSADPYFLYNYINNVKNKKYCFFVNPGTAALYAGYMGLKLLHVDFDYEYIGKEKFSSFLEEGRKKMNPARCKFLVNATVDECAQVLGEDKILSVSDMRHLIMSLT